MLHSSSPLLFRRGWVKCRKVPRIYTNAWKIIPCVCSVLFLFVWSLLLNIENHGIDCCFGREKNVFVWEKHSFGGFINGPPVCVTSQTLPPPTQTIQACRWRSQQSWTKKNPTKTCETRYVHRLFVVWSQSEKQTNNMQRTLCNSEN